MNNISQKWFCFQCFVPKKKRVQCSVLKVWNHRHLVTSVFSRQMDHSSLHLVLHLHRCWSLLKISLFWERGLWRSLCPYHGACALYTSWSFLQEPWGNHSLGRILACRRLLAYPGQKGVEFWTQWHLCRVTPIVLHLLGIQHGMAGPLSRQFELTMSECWQTPFSRLYSTDGVPLFPPTLQSRYWSWTPLDVVLLISSFLSPGFRPFSVPCSL